MGIRAVSLGAGLWICLMLPITLFDSTWKFIRGQGPFSPALPLQSPHKRLEKFLVLFIVTPAFLSFFLFLRKRTPNSTMDVYRVLYRIIQYISKAQGTLEETVVTGTCIRSIVSQVWKAVGADSPSWGTLKSRPLNLAM